MQIKENLEKHRFSPFLSWSWILAGLVVFVCIHRVYFTPLFNRQFENPAVFVRPLYWGALFCYMVVGWLMISGRKLPFSNSIEVLALTSLLATCTLLLLLAATREYYSGTYLFTLLCFQIAWLGVEVLFRSRFVTYKFALFPTSLPLRAEDFPEQDVSILSDESAPEPKPKIDAVVVDFNVPLESRWQNLLAECQYSGIPILPLNLFLENVWGRIPEELFNETAMSLAGAFRPYLLIKPIVERLMALVGVVATFPLMLVAALAVKVTSPGPVFFRQQRIGRNGRAFTIYKLRTMHAGAERLGAFAVCANDRRLTKIGNFLRRYHIDELPQLFNVLKGDMAIVGPRPETIELTDVYRRTMPKYILRNQLLPGVTSWALIHQGNVSGIEDTRIKLSYDLFYLKHISCFLDFYIIVKTFWIMIIGIERMQSPNGLRLFQRKT